MTLRRSIFTLGALLVCVQMLPAQMTIYGYINDASTKERLIGAVIRIGGTDRGAITNGYGFFSLPDVVLPVAELRVTYIGYKSKRIVLRSAEWNNKPLDVQLCRSEIAAGEVVIEADRDRSHTLSTEMGVVSVPIQQIQSLPSVGGEVDLLKAMQLYSGVSSGQELSNGIFVRGGNFDQNLFLLDGVTIYNPNHLFGFFSVFNMDAIKSAELIKGGFPAEYGGKLSSIISFAMNEGDLEHTVLKGGVSLIACRLSVEGPWSSEKQGSYLVSARRSYLDPAFKSKTLDDDGTNAFYIFDLTAKMNYTVTDDDRVYLSAYFGRDNFTHGESGLNQTLFDMNLIWGNQAYNFRWNHLWSSRLFSNLSLVYSDYFSKQSTSLYSLISAKEPSVKDLSLKADGEFWIADNQSLLFGGAIIDHRYRATAGLLESGDETVVISAMELQQYLSYTWDVTQRIRMTMGLRTDYFSSGGFTEADPRLNLRLVITDDLSLKVSYARMHQFIHLLSASLFALPGDVYYPATEYLKPETSMQISAGMYSSLSVFNVPDVNASIEIYYKDMDHLPMFRQRFSSPVDERIREEVIVGKGWASGIDVQISRQSGSLTGWLAYSYLSSWRQYEEKNLGKAFHPKFDRTHQVNLVLDYALSDRWKAGIIFTAATGQPVTIPRERYMLLHFGRNWNREYILDYGEIYSERLSFYNRLDVSATYGWRGWGVQWELFMNLYNVYNYPIPMIVAYDGSGREFVQLSIGFVPTIGVNFTF